MDNWDDNAMGALRTYLQQLIFNSTHVTRIISFLPISDGTVTGSKNKNKILARTIHPAGTLKTKRRRSKK